MNDTNCYNICKPDEYHYFDDLNETHCVNKCPYGFKLERYKCTKIYTDEYPYDFLPSDTKRELEVHVETLISIPKKIPTPINRGEIEYSLDGFFIFDSTNIKPSNEMNFKI